MAIFLEHLVLACSGMYNSSHCYYHSCNLSQNWQDSPWICPTLVPKSPSTDIIVSHYAKYTKGLWHNHLVGYPVLVYISRFNGCSRWILCVVTDVAKKFNGVCDHAKMGVQDWLFAGMNFMKSKICPPELISWF